MELEQIAIQMRDARSSDDLLAEHAKGSGVRNLFAEVSSKVVDGRIRRRLA